MNYRFWIERAKPGQPGVPTPKAARFLRRVLGPILKRVHRTKLEGLDRLPEGPFLLVANHSGLGMCEVFALGCAWLERFGCDRPLAGMAHPFAFSIWPMAPFLRGVGAIPSTYEHAEAALSAGTAVVVFPGGDHEATRPIWQARRVDFNGRKGFLRLARRAGVPVVPMGIDGAHYTMPILLRADRWLSWLTIVPALLGVRRLPVTVLGVIGAGLMAAYLPASIGWGWTALLMALWVGSPLSMFPWVPWTIRMRIGDPIAPDALFPGEDDDLDRAYHRVVTAVQERVVSG